MRNYMKRRITEDFVRIVSHLSFFMQYCTVISSSLLKIRKISGAEVRQKSDISEHRSKG